MLDILLKISIGLGAAGGLASKLASDRVAGKVPGIECHVVVPRQTFGDWLSGHSGIWDKKDRKRAVNLLTADQRFIAFARTSGSKRIRIYPSLDRYNGQVRMPRKARDGDFNVFIFSTPEKSIKDTIPSVSVAEICSGPVLRPTGGEVYSDLFGHPLAQKDAASNSLYFLGLISSGINKISLTPLVNALSGGHPELEACIVNIDKISYKHLFPSNNFDPWTQELKACIAAEAQKVRDVAAVEMARENRSFSVRTNMIIYQNRKLGRFLINYSLGCNGWMVTWQNLSFGAGRNTGSGRPNGHAPLVDEKGSSYLHIAIYDIPMALAAFEIEKAVRLSIRVLKSSLDTQGFYAALGSYPPA